MSLTTKMLASKLICYFSSHPEGFRFHSSTPPDNITFTFSNRKADQFLSDFQTGVGAAAYATLDTEQLFFHLRVSLLILFPLYLILRESLYLCLKYMNCFSRFMTFWTMLCFILFPGSIMRSGLHSSLLHNLRNVIPSSEACLYGHINLSLVQVQQQSSLGLSQSFSL